MSTAVVRRTRRRPASTGARARLNMGAILGSAAADQALVELVEGGAVPFAGERRVDRRSRLERRASWTLRRSATPRPGHTAHR